MSVSNGQRGNETILNAAFVSRTANTSLTGKIDLLNTADVASGTTIINAQREHNSIASFVGKALNIAKDAIPAWPSNIVGLITDDLMDRVVALVALFHGTTGHTHNGINGDGTKVSSANVTSVPAGNLVASNVQSALDELQSDIDTRATTTALSAHEVDTTSIHGITDTADIVLKTGAQTITGLKSFDPGVALAEIATPATPTSGYGKLYFKTDGKVYSLNDGGAEIDLTAASVPAVSVQTKLANYTVTTSDDVLLGDASGGAFTFTLPTAAGNTGDIHQFKKTDSSTNVITIDANGAELIDGSLTTTLNTQYESIHVVSDGVGWALYDRDYPKAWVSYTPTSSHTSNATTTGQWRRVGDGIEVQCKNAYTGATDGASLTFSIPNTAAWTIDTAKLVSGTSQSISMLGSAGTILDTGTNSYSQVRAAYDTSTTVRVDHGTVSGANLIDTAVTATSPFTIGNTDMAVVHFKVPITGFK